MSHECPANDCTQRVSVEMLMCRQHWYMVPKSLRNAVWNTWQDGAGAGSLAHDRAMDMAIQAVNRKLAAS